MAVSGLCFSSWGFTVDIGALFGFCKTGRSLAVSDRLHADRAEFAIVVDRMAVLVDGLAIHGGLATDGIPAVPRESSMT